MQQEINKIIEENLPKQLGEVLQKRLQFLETVEQDYNLLKETHETQRKSLIDLPVV